MLLLAGCGADTPPAVDPALPASGSTLESSNSSELPISMGPIEDPPGVELIAVEVRILMRVPREPADGVLRVTGYREYPPHADPASPGLKPLINRVIELPPGAREVRTSLSLQPELYYRASFGTGEVPLRSDPVGPSMQLVRQEEGSVLSLVVQQLLD